MAPEIISLFELRNKIHVGPCGFLTMARCLFLIKSSQSTPQRANPGCAIPTTPQELIRLNKPPAKLLEHISKLQWRSVKWLRLRQIAGIYNYGERILPCIVWHWGKPQGIKMRLEKKDYHIPITTGRSPLPSRTNINFDF